MAFLQFKYRRNTSRALVGLGAFLLLLVLSCGDPFTGSAEAKRAAVAKKSANFSKSAKKTSRKKARKKSKRRSKSKRRRKARPVRKSYSATAEGRLDHAVDLARAGKFADARAKAKRSGLPGSGKLVSWLILQHTGNPATLIEIRQFLSENPHWPRRRRLLARAEAALFFRPGTAQETLSYFKDSPPKTGVGMAALARANKRLGDVSTAKSWLRRAWTENRLGGGLDVILLKDMGQWLTADDHMARAAFLTYVRAPKDLMKLMKRLKKKQQRAQLLAQASFLFQSKRAPGRLKAVPASLRSSAPLAYARSTYWRKKNKHKKARGLVIGAASRNTGPQGPEAWWKERRFHAREALGAGNYKLAYAISSVHDLKTGLYFAQAEFLAGWIALVHLNKPKLAFDHFSALRRVVTKSRSISRADYWAGRALRKLELPKTAHGRFASAAKYDRTFYGQLSRDEIGRSPSVPAAIDPAPIDEKTKQAFAAREPVRLTRLLTKVRQTDLAVVFLYGMASTATNRQDFVMLAGLAREMKLPHVSLRIAKKAEGRGYHMGKFAYPNDVLPSFAQLTDPVASPLIHSVIRQESEFRTKAKSHAGARGLMQLMPRTARTVARQHKQRYRRDRLTSDPAYNLQIGTALLHDLLRNHRGSYIMALTSYNAGPGRTLKWAAQFGDPRADKVDAINWIETIPFDETRNYVQKVMENLQVYRSYIMPTQCHSLTLDLGSGTPPEKSKPATKKANKKSARKKG